LRTSIIVCMSKGYKSELVNSLIQIKTKEEMEAFLEGLLTPKELEELPKRLEIFTMLKQGVTQHEIAEKLGTSIATVTRGSLELKRGAIQKTSWWQNLSNVRG
jgi:TrpR family transcriptional regulator, trp operon repressor